MPHGPSRVQSTPDGLAVVFPGWQAVRGLAHGTTTRAALPGGKRPDFFEMIGRLRGSGVLPERFTLGGDQVHGDAIAVVDLPLVPADHPPGFRWDDAVRVGQFAATDALVTNIPGVLLVVQTADCLPVFLVDRAGGIVGLAHCGRKGTLAGLAAKTARAMAGLGAAPARIEAWVGPGVCTRHYPVGAEIIERFQASFPAALVSPDGEHLDLAACVRWQLEEAGLLAEQIFDSGECTSGDLKRYTSYRAEGDVAGRLISFIGFAPPAG